MDGRERERQRHTKCEEKDRIESRKKEDKQRAKGYQMIRQRGEDWKTEREERRDEKEKRSNGWQVL